MKRLLPAILFFVLTASSWATTRTISNTGGNWSSTSAWVGAATPAVGDAVIASVSSGPITVDTTTATCASLDLNTVLDPAGINFAAAATLTVAGGVTFATGQTVSGTGGLVISANSTIQPDGTTFPGVLYLGAHTYTLAGNWTCSGAVSTTGNATLNSNTLTISGTNFTHNNPLTGTTAINLTGTALTWTGTGAFSCAAVTINSGGTVTMSGTVNLGNTLFTYTAGPPTFVAFSSVINITGNSVTFNTGVNCPLCLLNFSGINPTITLQADLYCTQNNVPVLKFTQNNIGNINTVTMAGAFNLHCLNFSVDDWVHLKFVAGQTLFVTTSFGEWGTSGVNTNFGQGAQILSTSPGTKWFLNYSGNLSSESIMGGNASMITDCDASTSAVPILIYNGSGSMASNINVFNVALPNNGAIF